MRSLLFSLIVGITCFLHANAHILRKTPANAFRQMVSAPHLQTGKATPIHASTITPDTAKMTDSMGSTSDIKLENEPVSLSS